MASATAATGGEVLVDVQSRFYAEACQRVFPERAGHRGLHGRVVFASLAESQQKRERSTRRDRLVVCPMRPTSCGEAITSPTLPAPIDFLLTQHTATATYHALDPMLNLRPSSRYLQRVRAIHDPITRVATGEHRRGAAGLRLSERPRSLSPPDGTVPGNDRGPTDYVEIEIEDGRGIHRGRQSRVYIYDPASAESRSLGFRCVRRMRD